MKQGSREIDIIVMEINNNKNQINQLKRKYIINSMKQYNVTNSRQP